MASRHHTFRIPDEVWAAALSRARLEGTTVTAEVTRFVIRYGRGTPGRSGGAGETRGDV